MKNFPSLMLYATLPLMLIACSDHEIESVKNAYTDRTATTTYANLLESKDYCEKITWNKFLDEQNRTTVEYQCKIKSSQDGKSMDRVKLANKITKERDSKIEYHQRIISEIKENQKAGYPDFENDINEFLAKIERFKKERSKPIVYDETIKYIEDLGHLITAYRNNKSEENIIKLMTSDAFKTFIFQKGQYVRNYSRHDGIGGFSHQYSYMMRKETEEEREKYKQQNVQKYIDYNISFFPELEEGFQQATDKIKANYIASYDRDIAKYEKYIIQTKESRESTIKRERETLDRELANLKLLNENVSDEKIEDRVFVQYPVTGYAFERFQWIVNQDGKVTLTYGDIYALKESNDEEYRFYAFSNPSRTMAYTQNPIDRY